MDFRLQIPALHEGESYVGAIGDNAGHIYHVVLLPGDAAPNAWADQLEWARSIGGELPSRLELAMLFRYCPDEFKEESYWSNQLDTKSFDLIWYQTFADGRQGSTALLSRVRARAIRRLPVGTYDPSGTNRTSVKQDCALFTSERPPDRCPSGADSDRGKTICPCRSNVSRISRTNGNLQ